MSTIEVTKPSGVAQDDLALPPADESAKRRQILEGAREVFLRDGFDGTSMNEVARVAGVSKGTLYVYFDSKVTLFEALIREERQQQAERVCVFEPEDDERDLRSVLTRLGVELVAMIIRPASLSQIRTVIAVSAKFPQIGQAFYDTGPKFGRAKLAAYLQRRVAKGELAIPDVDLAAEQLVELFKSGTLQRLLFCVADKISTEEIQRRVENGVNVFLAAYGCKPAA